MRKVKFTIILFLISTSLIFTTYGGVFAGMELRSKAKKLNDKNIKTTVKKFNFFDKKFNEGGDYTNDFTDNGDGTITDQATGLMWEQKGSDKPTSWYTAKKHVKKLKKKKFAGYKNWRIPTIEELYSLLDPQYKQLYISPVFETKAYHCWSVDKSDLFCSLKMCEMRNRYLTIDYKKGTVSEAFTGDQPGGASVTNFRSFIRAVRSIK